MRENPLSYKVFHRRNLPHIQPVDGILFVTYRLYFPLPMKYRNNYSRAKKNFHEYFFDYDEYLDMCKLGPKWLYKADIGQIVFENLLKMNQVQYELFCFCIMPNHVHVLMKPKPEIDQLPFSIAKIMHGHKGVTSKKINNLLNRKGHFWQSEYYDHYVRNNDEFYNIAWYIINNPVKAKLVSKIKNWKFTWIEKQLEYELGLDLL
ncbi:MAG: hypothetical protein DRI23_12175 [Candidatus Cloacimonadota bacterium]|nr:MAG: hypothetical protein DRI23_12175 [Candidatus Cloacimonadota bacterium]RLC54294.1 MAG: hypothetical protein DRH79_01010 [Candidatus Cloacimonadota bacterium]